ncbi:MULTISPECIES: biotin synthase BioB [Acinetobacter]|uniref:Biotin synthase n=2 Tax=Acinetobacter baylyi TaxID=202950 RepID=BIOB_ACIAD|nr:MULTISPECIES: biotin synthase BioB [Acinetobacter]Q6FAP9.2 RecName: Full=Biotin synthase [Acinetobacter baylyi ADP1]ENV53798.1 biotin synthase [Acinetobacter baylyi DSM 14961 = CIP 107474]KAF2373229.1 biotin synthase BioB [Acinetobacter baylyi]KAF2374354.1 biotin synthase BioB [Acinetobacter baylyi]KAF2378749.1 biotin synthase BioB [Acinetobacter baylyi]KAF2381063.1 biotin synthase BioB [Acinetobacter baylyi]
MTLRNDWTRDEIQALYDQPFLDLVFQAQQVHREHFSANTIQVSTLLSIKTGKCPEDCKYCSQSAHYDSKLEAEKRIAVDKVISEAKAAKDSGSSRFCMGAAWRNPHERDMPYVLEMVREVKALGLETCMTLGMLNQSQAERLSDAGLDYYNHNLDTSREYYNNIISTRTFDDRLNTLDHVRSAGMKVCSGGIVGLGEQKQDRIGLLHELATLPIHPESVPINMLVPIEGTPLADVEKLDVTEWIRTIAVARIIMPYSYIRLSAGRESLSDSDQALAFMAGANSLFSGDKLLTTPNAGEGKDQVLFAKLGLVAEKPKVSVRAMAVDAMSA